MTYDELLEKVMDFYGDTSRSRSETQEALRDLRSELATLIESLN